MEDRQVDQESPLDRIFQVTGCRTQTQLARLLGIRQSSISDAKKRNSIPPEWLLTLFRLRRINPDWITNGTGPRHVTSKEISDPDDLPHPELLNDQTIHQSILRCFPSEDLADELLRRCRKPGSCKPAGTSAAERVDNEEKE